MISLYDFYQGQEVPESWKNVYGIANGNKFVVTKNDELFFPIKDKYKKFIQWAIIYKNAWVGKVFSLGPGEFQRKQKFCTEKIVEKVLDIDYGNCYN